LEVVSPCCCGGATLSTFGSIAITKSQKAPLGLRSCVLQQKKKQKKKEESSV
ncbi:hypothetical protein IscW_ISCW010432, partial [Ixodes scapularis]